MSRPLVHSIRSIRSFGPRPFTVRKYFNKQKVWEGPNWITRGDITRNEWMNEMTHVKYNGGVAYVLLERMVIKEGWIGEMTYLRNASMRLAPFWNSWVDLH